jgi:hypothetical protein
VAGYQTARVLRNELQWQVTKLRARISPCL